MKTNIQKTGDREKKRIEAYFLPGNVNIEAADSSEILKKFDQYRRRQVHYTAFFIVPAARNSCLIDLQLRFMFDTTEVFQKQDRQCTYNVIQRHLRVTIFAGEKQYLLHIPSVCLQPQVSSMECACAILSSMVCPALKYFSTLSHKRYLGLRGTR